MKRLRLSKLHDRLDLVSLFWLKDMLITASKLSASIDPTDFGITSVLQNVGNRVGTGKH